MSKKLGFVELTCGHCNLVFLVFQSDVVFPGNKMQITACGMLSLAERFTNKLEQPRFTWLPHYLAKAINLCGQACKAGLSVQIAHNQEMCVQLCIWPYWTQSWDSGIMDEWQLFVLLVWGSLYDLIIIIHYIICHFVDFEGLS